MRWGLGPVFIYECLANARRWQTYATRSVGLVILLAALATIANSRQSIDPVNTWREHAALGESYFYAIIGVELTLVLLAAPAATAGAICIDRARGTLAHVLATDLTDPEIVLGKLGARLLPVLGLVACTWPVLAISSLLGGIDPTALTLAFAIILAVALLGCSMALALSVWARRPHDVVLVTYTFWMVVLLVWPIGYAASRGRWATWIAHWSLVADPYYLAFARYAAPNQVDLWDYFGFFAGTLGLSGVLTILAVWWMRPVACRGTGERHKEPTLGLVGRLTRWLPGPSLDRNPVLWREWHRTRPSRWLMILIAIIGGLTGIACLVGSVLIWVDGLDDFRNAMGFITGMFGSMIQLIFGLLILSAVAPTSMAEERQRGSLDLLATTTLSTRAIVLGKWMGTLRLVPLLALGPCLLALALATAYKSPSSEPQQDLTRLELLLGATLLIASILAHGALIASIGVALAVWVKQQSRAIAASVAIAVLISAGWPIFVGVSRMGPAGGGMLCLSPVVTAMLFTETLSNRYGPHAQRLFWSTAFWDIECFALALGLLWLTVRTFDRCIGRLPERPRRVSVLSDVIGLLAAMIGAGSLFGAIAMWLNGMIGFNPGWSYGYLGCALMVTAGLLLVAVHATGSISRPAMVREPDGTSVVLTPDRRLLGVRWWESYRLVLLLTIGPALLDLAVGTAYRPVTVVPATKTLPDGTKEEIRTDVWTGTTEVITRPPSGAAIRRKATAAEIAARQVQPERSLTSYLTTGGLAVLTILTHGAWVISLGLALGVGFHGRSRPPAIAISVLVFLLVSVAWPLFFYLYLDAGPMGPWAHPKYPRGLGFASPLTSLYMMIGDFPPREDLIAEYTWWCTFWDLLFLLLAVAIGTLALAIVDHKLRAYPSPALETKEEPAAIETVLVGD